MSYADALQRARRLAERRRQAVYVVLADAYWHEYETATEEQLETYFAGSHPLAYVDPEGVTTPCH